MLRWIVAATMAVALPTACSAETIVVFAAASLKVALDPVAANWREETGNTAVVSYGSSAALAVQIQQGAPADIFLSAAKNWMDALAEADLLAAGTRVDLWGNALSVVAHDPMSVPFSLDPSTDFAGMIGDQKLAMAFVDSVPVGQYGKDALIQLGQWDRVMSQVVQTQDARSTLALVTSGEAAYGIVYATDAKAAETAGLAIEVSRFPESSHAPIVYPGAVLKSSARPEAHEFLSYLGKTFASEVFAAQGFRILAQ